MAAAPVTLLFTDLVDSTALLQRVGDERAQRILHAHRQLLREALASHGGREVKWLGDGVLTTFTSVADGVRCAMTMAQRARRPVAGERLGLRVGLHVGEVLPDEADYVGTPVVLARRLCDQATAGQILCGSVVVELLRGRRGFEFATVGPLELKGFPEPVVAYEVRYRPEAGAALLRHTPFTGRTAELGRLTRRLDEVCAGHGGVVLLAGEPGIGKTRTIEEATETARAQGALVLWGRCYEGEAARPFGPIAEALSEYVRGAAPEALRADLGLHAAPLTRLVPVLRERIPDLPEPMPLEPAEERVRLLDAVAQSLLALAARVPTVLVLDDLHWADAGTVALLRHVARFTPRARLLVLGAYRDVEVASDHPLTEALGTLPRETSYEQLGLGGLDATAIKELVDTVAEREMPAVWVETLTRETSGNPFFLREVLLHLAEEGALGFAGRNAPPGPGSLRIPETVHQVIARRLARLPEATNQFLRVAAAFTGGIDFEVARRVARLEERVALDGLDAALGAQLLVPAGGHDSAYDFTHALVRHTLYERLSRARQARLHREIAEGMEAVYADRAVEHAAEIARHYHHSASLQGAERGVPHCLAAAAQAERAAAFADVVEHLRAALDLLPPVAAEQSSLLARFGLALIRAAKFDEGVSTACEAARRIAHAQGRAAAAAYLANAAAALYEVGAEGRLDHVVHLGLEYAGERRDLPWATLKAFATLLASHDLGIPEDTPDQREIAAVFAQSNEPRRLLPWFVALPSRAEMEACDPRLPNPPGLIVGVADAGSYLAGENPRDLRRLQEEAAEHERVGSIGRAVGAWAIVSRFQVVLGEFAEARETRRRANALAERLPEPPWAIQHLIAAEDEWRVAMDDAWDAPFENLGPGARHWPPASQYRASVEASIARSHAHMGRMERAMRRLASVLPAIEGAPGWAPNYVRIVCDAAATLWLIERKDHVEIIERNLREKVIAPDFRYPMVDSRLAMARLCALQQRYNEAVDWFAKARTVLDQQGARPLRAIVDFDEALMYARRGEPGDAERARPLLDAALARFRSLGMPGWIRRAETLLKSCAAGGARAEGHSQ
ncbi:MAG TPA: AAA family ATPase [Candidatus Binatia bacterium]|nr:AAA family ATPase [Candidatus Binatia bacterium]